MNVQVRNQFVEARLGRSNYLHVHIVKIAVCQFILNDNQSFNQTYLWPDRRHTVVVGELAKLKPKDVTTPEKTSLTVNQ